MDSTPLLTRVLAEPRYGFSRNGKFYKPTHSELFQEFFFRLNIFRSKKNWLPFAGWFFTLSLALPLSVFSIYFFSFPLAVCMFFYSMVLMGSFGTFWFHRYGTHRAFQFKSNIFKAICRDLVIKIIPDEVYIVSHHVHHQYSEKAGDPYNVHGGWLYCFLADVNHQMINPNLNENDYKQLSRLLKHTGIHLNSYAQYQKWGSLCHPGWTVLHYILNWAFWYGVFFLMGGHALATALFGAAGVWAIGIRTFNYEGHGGGKDKRRTGIDFNTADLSINQTWPGYVAGEWHNNHHLYPTGARSGFLPYQLDLPWLFIRLLHRLGMVSSFLDFKAEFLSKYYKPHLAQNTKAEKFIFTKDTTVSMDVSE